ncbi:MAG: DsrH/TusB family sulfur metabolism protein, partial [Candidatus Hodarchaeota archaeon]
NPQDITFLETLQNGSSKKIGVILFQNGVWWLQSKHISIFNSNCQLFALKEDNIARGIPNTNNSYVTMINYDGMIDLLMDNPNSVISLC